MSSDCVLLPQQYNLIWRVSFFSLGSSMYAMHHGHYAIALSTCGVFLTSINYWYKPDYSWRRYFDMAYVKCAVLYQFYRAYYSQNVTYFYLLSALGIYFYILGINYHKKNLLWHSTYAHCMLHIVGNIANIILYSGYIP
jgi:hypothetical protein